MPPELLDWPPTRPTVALLATAALAALMALSLIALIANRLHGRPRLVVVAETLPNGRAQLTTAQKRGLGGIGTPLITIAVLLFIITFKTMRQELEHTFGHNAGEVVLLLDLFVGLSSIAVPVLLWCDIRIPGMRFVPFFFISSSIALNWSAAEAIRDRFAHALLPAVWFLVVEGFIAAVGQRLSTSRKLGDDPIWSVFRIVFYAKEGLPEWLAWKIHPRDKDITPDLHGAKKHLERVRAAKRQLIAERAADGLPRWPLMLTRSHRDALQHVMDRMAAEREEAVAELVGQRDQVTAALTEANQRLADGRAEVDRLVRELATAQESGAAAGSSFEENRRWLIETQDKLAAAEASVRAIAADRDVALADAVEAASRIEELERALARATDRATDRASGVPGTRASRRAPDRAPGRASNQEEARGTDTVPGTDADEDTLSPTQRIERDLRELVAQGVDLKDINLTKIAQQHGKDGSVGRKAAGKIRAELAGLHAVPPIAQEGTA